MSLDIADTISSTFSRLSQKSTLGLIGLILGLLSLLLVGVVATAASATVSTALAAALGLLTAALYLGGIASFTVGSLRTLDEHRIETSFFTENIVWPFLRISGSNLVIQTFILMAVYLVLYPALLIGMGTSGFMGVSGSMPQISSGGYIALGLGGIVTVFAVLYTFAALSLSLPRIAINDKRLFQSLDESVQSTSGLRLKVIATMVPFAGLVALSFAALAMEGILGSVIHALGLALAGLYWLSLLAELNERL